jgi:hypothetical protein
LDCRKIVLKWRNGGIAPAGCERRESSKGGQPDTVQRRRQ